MVCSTPKGVVTVRTASIAGDIYLFLEVNLPENDE